MTNNVDIKALAIKHGYAKPNNADIEAYIFTVKRLQDFAAEWLSLNSSEAVGYVSGLPIKNPQSIRSDANDVFKTAVYAANPINQQLLSERNECVEAMQRLKSAFHTNMLRAFPNKTHQEISDEIDKALSTPDSIKKLLEEVK